MSSVSDNHRIVLKAGYTEGGAEHEEGILDGAAYPGMNVVMTQDPRDMERDTFTAGGTDYVGTGTGDTTTKAPIKVLKEDALQGKTIDDAYADGDVAFIHIAKPGDVLQVLVTSGQSVVKGDGLTAQSTGKWNVDATNSAVEALEGSGGALAADTHVRVRVL